MTALGIGRPARGRTRLRTGVAVAAALVFAAVGVAWGQYEEFHGGLHTSDALNNLPPSKTFDETAPSPTGAMNILLIGLDSRKDQDGNPLPPAILNKLHAGNGDEGGYNTNTLILMHIPAGGGRATAFSIPRDDLVSIPGEHPDKIKKAYGYAKSKAENELRATGVTDQHQLETQSRDAGRRATFQVVRELTGVPIDHFAEVNLAGFYDLAHALGGVEVCLNHPVHDDYSGANFRAGRQMLDGAQALAFVRQRHGLTNGDLDRTHRQQAFLAAVAAKLRGASILTDPGKLQQLLRIAREDVVIDSRWNVLSFAHQEQNLAGGNLDFHTLPIKGYSTNGNGEDVNLIDPVQVRDMVRAAFGYQPATPPPPPAAATTVDIQDGSGAAGLVGRVSDLLNNHGFPTGAVTHMVHQTNSTVHYHPGDQVSASAAGQQLGGLALVPDDTIPSGRLQVVLGTDLTLPSGTSGPPARPAALPAPATAAQPEPPPPAAPADIPCVD